MKPGLPGTPPRPPGDVAQLGERRLCKAEVRGSSPLISTRAEEANNQEQETARFDNYRVTG